MQISNFIRTYDNVIPKNIRESLIYKFNLVDPTSERNTDLYKFKEVCLQNHFDLFQPEFEFTYRAFERCVQKYKQDLKITFFPENPRYEIFRLKKYQRGDGYFDSHIDVYDTKSMLRFLTFFCYLNDGGGTKFPELGITIESKPGRLLMFPPMWMFPHEAIVSRLDDKYILHTYLHYSDII